MRLAIATPLRAFAASLALGLLAGAAGANTSGIASSTTQARMRAAKRVWRTRGGMKVRPEHRLPLTFL
jgi:hypothetical protein